MANISKEILNRGEVRNHAGGINVRKKGQRHELVCAKLLKEWTGLDFYRVPMSGALHGRSPAFMGDVTCMRPYEQFPFFVECKHYKNAGIGVRKRLRENSVVYKIFKKAKLEADAYNYAPMLIIKENFYLHEDFMFIFDFNPLCLSKLGLNADLDGEGIVGYKWKSIKRVPFADFRNVMLECYGRI